MNFRFTWDFFRIPKKAHRFIDKVGEDSPETGRFTDEGRRDCPKAERFTNQGGEDLPKADRLCDCSADLLTFTRGRII